MNKSNGIGKRKALSWEGQQNVCIRKHNVSLMVLVGTTSKVIHYRHTGIKSFSFFCWTLCIVGQKVSTKSWMTAISLSPLQEYCYYLVRSSNIRVKGGKIKEGKQSDKAAIRDLVLTFCPTMCSVQQRKLKLLMLVLKKRSHTFK